MGPASYYVAAAIASIFFILKVCDEKFFSKSETFKMNGVLKSSGFVYVASLIGIALMDAVTKGQLASKAPGAFLDKPTF